MPETEQKQMISLILDLVDSHFKMIHKQAKPYSSSLVFVLMKLLRFTNNRTDLDEAEQKKLSSILKHFIKLVQKKVTHPSVVLCEIAEVLSKHSHFTSVKNLLDSMRIPKLSYLSLRKEIPAALPTYHPQIDDEFIPSKASAWKREQKNTEKVLK